MKYEPLLLPALRGSIGDWIYYACLMPMSEIGIRVNYAAEIHPDRALSQLMQRSLEGSRARHIASYLTTTKDRFFNSLVLATYGGNPDWLEVGNFKSSSNPTLVRSLTEDVRNSLGFLRLTGTEKIFAVDGQHRLAGIKRVLTEGGDLTQDQVPVLLVGHKKSVGGLQRTRRLFTTLNKTAKPVHKRDIISLDEDDVMAIITRRLVENHEWFRDPKIAVISSQNIPVTNRTCLTTISSLYDTLKVLFTYSVKQQFESRADQKLQLNRPSDARLDEFYELAISYFTALGKTFKPVANLFAAQNPSSVAAKHRGPHGGHLLFRPIGLDIVTRTAVEIAESQQIGLPEALVKLKRLPTDISAAPYLNVIWDPDRHKVGRERALARDLVRYMAGLPVNEDKLKNQYSLALGIVDADDFSLPPVLP
jgi:DNA sulfur modification protein DndB